ncbi:MAG TPA: TRAP transporter substrate-binding protein [Burkholderiales bacterium]|nr:TRAP transporter substrate-binding protein [Burkholderiales bacterium]
MKQLSKSVLAAGCAAVLALATGCGERDAASDAPAAAGPADTGMQSVHFDLASIYPTSLTVVGESAHWYAESIKRASGGAITFRVYEPGALVPGLESIQAVSRGSVDAAWSSPGFFSGTDSAFNMFSTVPFGPAIPEYLAWMYDGGGVELLEEMFAKYDIHPVVCGIHSPEASGWFRKEIKTLGDLKGLKMRFFGFGAKVMEKLDVSTQMLAPGDIFQALQLGTIDATEFSMPALDESLGFYQVAKYYYFPGWHQQASIFNLFINKTKWDALPDQTRAMIDMACGDMVRRTAARSEAIQWKAMQTMRDKHGVKLMRWSDEILAAYEKAWNEVVEEESASNPNFKKVYASYSQFRDNYSLWHEYGYLQR